MRSFHFATAALLTIGGCTKESRTDVPAAVAERSQTTDQYEIIDEGKTLEFYAGSTPTEIAHALKQFHGLETLETIRFKDRHFAAWQDDHGVAQQNIGVTAADIKPLADLHRATTWTFHNCDFDRDAVREISKNTALRRLAIRAAESFVDDDVKALSGMDGLSTLELSSCNKITSAGIMSLGTLDQLNVLDLYYCGLDRLEFDACAAIGRMAGLELLRLPGVDDKGIAALTDGNRLGRLRSLSLQGSFSGAAIVHVNKLRTLQHLSLAAPHVTDDGFRSLHLPELTDLELRITKIKGPGLRGFSHTLRHLSVETGRSLMWSQSELNDPDRDFVFDLPSIEDLKMLESIKLTEVQLDSVNVAHLKGLKRITIEIPGPAFDDEALRKIGMFKELGFIRLSVCDEITTDGLKYLADLNNECEVQLHLCKNLESDNANQIRALLPRHRVLFTR